MMKSVSRFALASAFVATWVGASYGQELSYKQELSVPQQCALKLAQPPVISKLKLSPAQLKAVKAAELKYDSESKRIEADRSASDSARAAVDKRFANACLDALTVEQKHQILKLGVPEIGVPALLDPTISEQLGLTTAQLKKIRDITFAYQKSDEDVSAMIANAIIAIPEPKVGEDQAAYDKKCSETAKAYEGERQRVHREKIAAEKKVLEILTPTQKTKWEDLAGKPTK